jgi:hypothetical protein
MKSFTFSSLFALVALPGSSSRLNRVEEFQSTHRGPSPDIESVFREENNRQLNEQEVEDARFLDLTAMPTSDSCDAVYECPVSCDCNDNVQDGNQEICRCYDITSVQPPFDTSVSPPSGTWYCFQVDLDKTAEGCSDAKEVSNSVLTTGFSESCMFHPSKVANRSDNWKYHTCGDTAATGLKYDFGHNEITGGNTSSVTYCLDVSCEVAPAGEGSVTWVLKADNDRCEIEVTDGAIPNCGLSNHLCSPSCPSDDDNGDERNGGKDSNKVIESGAGSDTSVNEFPPRIYGPIVGVFGFAAIAGVVYVVAKKKVPSTVGGDEFSTSSAGTSL